MPRTTTPARFWGLVDYAKRSMDDCWPWTGRFDEKGYGRIGFRKRPNVRAHRIAWELTNGPLPDGVVVCHHCDNPACCNPRHLFLGTQIDNIADRHAKGRTVDPPSRRKLTERDVSAMRAAWESGDVTQQELADRFGVSRGNVSKIVNGVSYV